MRFWRRAATLTIGSRRYTLDDLQFSFAVELADDSKLPICKLDVTNLAPDTRGQIKKGVPVALAAGYQDDAGTIFAGNVTECSHEPGDVDVVTKITAADSIDAWLSKAINKTYRGPIRAKDMLDDLLTVFGVEVSLVNLTSNKEYPRGRVCTGKLKDVITAVVKDCGSRLLIRNSQVIIQPAGEGVQRGYLLTPQTGLLRAKKQAQGTAAVGASDNLIERTCLLNYHLGVGDRVVIRDSSASGEYSIRTCKHTGSRSGSWQTVIEVEP